MYKIYVLSLASRGVFASSVSAFITSTSRRTNLCIDVVLRYDQHLWCRMRGRLYRAGLISNTDAIPAFVLHAHASFRCVGMKPRSLKRTAWSRITAASERQDGALCSWSRRSVVRAHVVHGGRLSALSKATLRLSGARMMLSTLLPTSITSKQCYIFLALLSRFPLLLF